MKTIAAYIRILGERDNSTAKVLIVSAVIVLAASFFPSGESIESNYRIGMIWTEKDLIAPFSFPIYREEREYQRERTEAAEKVYPVFEENQTVALHSIDSLQHFFSELQSVLDFRNSLARRKTRQSHTGGKSDFSITSDSTSISAKQKMIPVTFTESEWSTLQKLRYAETQGPRNRFTIQALKRDVLLVLNQLYLQGILDIRKNTFSKRNEIAYRKKMDEQIVPVSKYLDQEDLGRSVEQIFLSGYRHENDTLRIAAKITLSFLSPNIIFQRGQTEKEIALAIDEVPRSLGVVQENERIIAKHERVTDEVKLKLDSIRKAKAERGGDINTVTTFLGKLLHIAAILTLFGIYLYLFRKKIFHNNAKILLIALVILLECVFALLSLHINIDAPVEFLIFIPVASMLLAIIFDSRVAFYGTIVTSLIIAGIRGNDYSIAFSSIIAGTLTVYTVRDIKHRTQIFRSITFIFIGYFISILAMSLERYESFLPVLQQLLFAGVNAVFSPVLTYGLLIFFERFFHVATDLTLLELSDFNHPLLRELSQKAPGTFHHSVNLGTMSEAAAEGIGANAILARVGAYYHDIGKITKPSLFVENQLGSSNRHERLNPLVSARVIAAHVRDGVILGREYGLPDVVLDFIPMHHGTTTISFFYEQALKRKGTQGPPNPADFRYPGPRPQTKETGIVMLADAVEASTKAIEQPTIQKIEDRIDAVIKARFMEGELDECELTLRDLTKIKESFLKILAGIHHARIRYPEEVLSPAANDEKTTSTSAGTAPVITEKRPKRRIRNIDAL